MTGFMTSEEVAIAGDMMGMSGEQYAEYIQRRAERRWRQSADLGEIMIKQAADMPPPEEDNN